MICFVMSTNKTQHGLAEPIGKEAEDELYGLLRQIFRVNTRFSFSDDMGPEEVPGWDSLGWVELLNAIEDRYKVRLVLEEAAGIQKIRDIRRIIASALECSQSGNDRAAS